MICGRPPSLANTRRQKLPAHKGCSASHRSWFPVCAGGKDGDFIIRFFQAKNKRAFHIPFRKPELTRAPNLLINGIKWPPPHSSLCCVILNNVTFLCCFKRAIVRFWEESERCLMLHRPPFGLFSHITRQLGELRVSKWGCASAYLVLLYVHVVHSWRFYPHSENTAGRFGWKRPPNGKYYLWFLCGCEFDWFKPITDELPKLHNSGLLWIWCGPWTPIMSC